MDRIIFDPPEDLRGHAWTAIRVVAGEGLQFERYDAERQATVRVSLPVAAACTTMSVEELGLDALIGSLLTSVSVCRRSPTSSRPFPFKESYRFVTGDVAVNVYVADNDLALARREAECHAAQDRLSAIRMERYGTTSIFLMTAEEYAAEENAAEAAFDEACKRLREEREKHGR